MAVVRERVDSEGSQSSVALQFGDLSMMSGLENGSFAVSIPSVTQIVEDQAEQQSSSWFRVPAMLSSAPASYTAYQITTTFEKGAENEQTFSVDRRFSQFEKLLQHLRSLDRFVLPELPKKRIFNQGEQVIELRRTELETFLRTLLRNPDLRTNEAVRAFLSLKDGIDEFLGDVGLYKWAYSSLASVDTHQLSFAMMRAVAKAEIESRSSRSSEPEKLQIAIPNYATQEEFLSELKDRIALARQLRDQFSKQAKIGASHARETYEIGRAFNVLSQINFTDTFQVVLMQKQNSADSENEVAGEAGANAYEMI